MPRPIPELVVIAKHGKDFIDDCWPSLGDKHRIVIMNTEDGGHPTGAYLYAYETILASNYLFIQDSMVATTPDYLEGFKRQMPELGAVAWAKFGYSYDTPAQQAWVEEQYKRYCPPPEQGIFGPIFYTNRASLNRLRDKGLLPKVPHNKMEAQATERAWAWAFKAAGIPVVGPIWDKGAMQAGFHGFRKVFANRQ